MGVIKFRDRDAWSARPRTGEPPVPTTNPMPIPPFLAKVIRIALIGFGAVTVVSALVNIVATVQLIGPSDAESLGLSRNAIISQYVLLIVVGIALIYFGARKKKE